MDQQTFAVYVNERYVPELARNRRRMNRHRRIWRFLQTGELVALVSVLTLLMLKRGESSTAWWTLGLCIAALACAAAQRAFHCDRRWIQEAQTNELLRQEWELYDAGMEGYGRERDPHRLFIHRIESHLSRSALRGKARVLLANAAQMGAVDRRATG